MMFKIYPIMIAALALVFIASCGHDDHDSHNLHAEACEHMADGPDKAEETDLDASADHNTLEVDDWEHKRLILSLNEDNANNYTGYIELQIGNDGEYLIFADQEVSTLHITPDNGEPAPADSVSSNSECSEIKQVHTYENLKVGTHTLKIEATTPTIKLVIEHNSSESHHDH